MLSSCCSIVYSESYENKAQLNERHDNVHSHTQHTHNIISVSMSVTAPTTPTQRPCDVTIVQFIIARFSRGLHWPPPPPQQNEQSAKFDVLCSECFCRFCDRPRLRALFPSRPHTCTWATAKDNSSGSWPLYALRDTRSTTWPQPLGGSRTKKVHVMNAKLEIWQRKMAGWLCAECSQKKRQRA